MMYDSPVLLQIGKLQILDYLDSCVELIFEFEGLKMIHVSVAVEEVTLKSCSRLLLSVACRPGLVLVVAIAVVPVTCQELKLQPRLLTFLWLIEVESKGY